MSIDEFEPRALRELVEWAMEKGYLVSRVKVGAVEIDLMPLKPVEVDIPVGIAEDSPTDLPDPDGLVGDELLYHSSGYQPPEDAPPDED